MKKLLLILICLFVSFEVKSEDEKIFDKYGKYKGKIENNKKIFDSTGSLRGSISR